MNEFIKILLLLSLSGTLFLFIMLLLKHFYKSVFSRCWQYYILLFAVSRFLVPLFFDYNITSLLYGMAGNILEQVNVPDENITDIDETKETETNGKVDIKETGYNNITYKKQASQNISRRQAVLDYILKFVSLVYKNLFYIWFILVIIFMERNIIVYKRFMDYIKAGTEEVKDANILNILAVCKEKLGVKKNIRLYCNPWISSPVLAGFLHPCIIIPAVNIEDKRMFYVFLHELVHYKRRDIFYKWFVQAVICIHWFNPFVQLLGKEINKACELSCDEAVISILDKKERRAYGDTLLSFVKTGTGYKNSLGMITLTEGALQLKERLGAIMDFKKKPVAVKIATIIVTIVICFSFTMSGAYAASDNKSIEDNIPDQQTIPSNIFKGNYGKEYNYYQRGLYQSPYIFEIGWDIRTDDSKLYNVKADVALEDNSKITVYFDDNVKNYYKDKKVLNAIAGLIDNIGKSYKKVKRPLVMRVTYVKTSDIPVYAKKYYKNQDITGFSALFPCLGEEDQKKYLDKMYNSGRIAFFSSVIGYLNKDMVKLYADKSFKKDGKVNFFYVLLNYVQPEDLERYASQSYKSGNVARFIILIPYMTKKQKESWLAKAKEDDKAAFYLVISKEL